MGPRPAGRLVCFRVRVRVLVSCRAVLCRLDLEPASLLTERPPLRPTLLVSAPAVYMYVRLL